jgi:hypothetical protein
MASESSTKEKVEFSEDVANAWKQNKMPKDASPNRVIPAREGNRIPQTLGSRLQQLGQAAAVASEIQQGNLKALGKRALNTGLRIAGNALLPGRGGEILADEKKRKAVLIGLLIVLFILLFIIFFIIEIITGGGVAQQGTQPGDTQTNPLTINKNCTPIANTNTGQCTVVVTFKYSAQDIIITDTMYKGASIVSSTWPKYTTGQDASGNPTITWKLSENISANPSPGQAASPAPSGTAGLIAGPINQSFTFTAQAQQNSWNLSTNAKTVGAVINDGTNAGYIPPNTNDCNGYYTKYMNLIAQYGFPKQNYGDPNCELTDDATLKDKIYNLILQTEQGMPNNTNSKEYAQIWFVTIIPQESSFVPDSFGIPDYLDAGGKWGLFQMGSSKPPGQAPPAEGQNGPNDRGDVNWQQQIKNAITYNHERLKCSFTYWSSFLSSGIVAKRCP